VTDSKNITEATTLAELREQCLLLEVISLRLYPSMNGEGRTAGVHHATGIYVDTGPTEATAIEAAFVKLRHALLSEPLKQYLEEIEDKESR
jgi:hypothetical protein